MFGITQQDLDRYQKLAAAGFTGETLTAAGLTVGDLDRLTIEELAAKRRAYEAAEAERLFNQRYPDED